MERTRVITVESIAELSKVALELRNAFPLGAVIGLSGELGAGKTTLVRAIVEHVCQENKIAAPRVTSPSFVIHQTYAKLKPPVEHYDLYRMDTASTEQLFDIGYFETLERTIQNRGFLFVEWPERVSDAAILRLNAWMKIDLSGPTQRVFHWWKV